MNPPSCWKFWHVYDPLGLGLASLFYFLVKIHVSLKISEPACARSCFSLGLWPPAQPRCHSASHTDIIFLHLFQELSLPCHLITGLAFKQLKLDAACWWIGHFWRQLTRKSCRGFSSTGSRTVHLSTAYGQSFPCLGVLEHISKPVSLLIFLDSFCWVSDVSHFEVFALFGGCLTSWLWALAKKNFQLYGDGILEMNSLPCFLFSVYLRQLI